MPEIGLLIIGDELLSGKRSDKHLGHSIEVLREYGLELAWAEYLGDNPARIISALKRAFSNSACVFSFGGIGATPDDHTRRCAALAAGQALQAHPEAVACIEAQFGAEAYPHRILMAELPAQARLIPNPINQVPGFSVNHVHFLPGFPQMAWPMQRWVLENHYADWFNPCPDVEETFLVFGARESNLLTLMNDFVQRFPQLRFSSLPTLSTLGKLELGVKGQPAAVAQGVAFLRTQIQALGYCLDTPPNETS